MKKENKKKNNDTEKLFIIVSFLSGFPISEEYL